MWMFIVSPTKKRGRTLQALAQLVAFLCLATYGYLFYHCIIPVMIPVLHEDKLPQTLAYSPDVIEVCKFMFNEATRLALAPSH